MFNERLKCGQQLNQTVGLRVSLLHKAGANSSNVRDRSPGKSESMPAAAETQLSE